MARPACGNSVGSSGADVGGDAEVVVEEDGGPASAGLAEALG